MDRSFGSSDSTDLTLPLPGRERDQQELATLLLRAADGDGSVVLISGEAGIGKTTLSERMLDQAQGHGMLVLTGHCYATTTGQPLAPWIQVHQRLSSTRPESVNARAALRSASADAAAGSRDELYEWITGDFRQIAASQPLAIMIEDIHWADTASLELIRYVSRQVSVTPMLLIVTFRENDPESEERLRTIVPDLVRESRAHRFELGRLGQSDVQAFVESQQLSDLKQIDSDSLAEYLYSRSEGNPFYMTELLRDLVRKGDFSRAGFHPVPSLVRQVIENRVHLLTSDSQHLLSVASVIGQDVPIDLWQQVTDVDETRLVNAIEDALAADILRQSQDGRRVQFVHGLIQETLYQGQLALRRRGTHARIAEILASQPRPYSGMVAHHFSQAGDSRAIEWYLRSAHEALDLYAARDAVVAIDQAETLAGETGIALPLEALRIRAKALEMLGETDSARTDISRLLQIAREGGDSSTECQALIDLAMLWTSRDYQQCGHHLKEALELSGQVGDARLRAQCLNRLANWQANIGEFPVALDHHQQALKIFEQIGDQDGISDTLDLLGTTAFLAGDYLHSRDYLEHSISISRKQDNRMRLSSSLALLSNIGGDMDATFDASIVASRSHQYWIDAGEESIQIAREIGFTSGEAFGLAMLGAVHCFRGTPGAALECAEQAESIAQRIGHQQWLTAASLVLGVARNELLDHSRAAYYLERTLGHARTIGSHLWTLAAAAALANVRLELGDTSGMALLEPFRDTWSTGRSHAERACQFAWARQLQVAGELDHALSVIDRIIAGNDRRSGMEGTPQVLLVRGEILLELDRLDEAGAAFEHAEYVADTLGMSGIRWRVLIARASLEQKRGNQPEATALLGAARASAVPVAREIRDPSIRKGFTDGVEQRIARVQRSLTQSGNDAGLSPRELEVLSLVTQGATDAQVAEQLFISPRTVARHLQSIYTKLNVNSRTAATRYAWEHNLFS
jgi:DNA-binding CsgD family transcriptional regulator/tetratricopeptide (TPR) repeat protein